MDKCVGKEKWKLSAEYEKNQYDNNEEFNVANVLCVEEYKFNLRKFQQQLRNSYDKQTKVNGQPCTFLVHEEIVLRDIETRGRNQVVEYGDIYSMG